MRFTALLLIGLVAMTMASYNPDVAFLRSLKRQTFGKTLMDTIQIQLSTNVQGNQIDTIIENLELLKKQNAAEEQKDDADNKKYQEEKKTMVKSLSSKITKFQGQIKSAKAIVLGNEQTIKSEGKFLKEQQKIVKTAKGALKKNIDEQKKVTDTYQKSYNQLASQLVALAAAKLEILKLKAVSTPGSFIQIQGSIKSIQFEHPKFQGMINVLTQMMTEQIISDQKLVQVIIDIIDKLSEELRKEQKLLTEAYDIKINDLKLQESRLSLKINLALAEISGAEVKIGRLEAENVNLNQKIVSDGQRVDEAILERKDTIKQANDRQKAYVQESTRRSNELEIINRVIQIFKTRFSADVRKIVNN